MSTLAQAPDEYLRASEESSLFGLIHDASPCTVDPIPKLPYQPQYERVPEKVGQALVLRDYQQTGIDQIRHCIKEGRKRVVLYLPTGGGKTKLAAGIIRDARAKGHNVLFVANRIELIKQAAEAFAEVGIPCGVIQGENSRAEWMPVLVCSIQTLAARKKAKGYPDAGLIIVDESHGVPGAKAYLDILAHYDGIPVIGLTATPFTKGMGKHFQDIVIAATIQDLIASGSLVDLDIYAPGEPDLSKVRTVAGDYDEKQLGEAVDTEPLVGDIVAHWLKLGQGKQTVVFATNVCHSEHIVEQFKRAGVTARHVSCYTADKERTQTIADFKAGKFRVLSNCSLLSEGFDAPAAEVMILARPTKSLTRYIQMCGRVLRPAPGKQKALLLDHSGTAKRLGFPTDELPLQLDDGKARSGTAVKPREEALPKPCPACTFLKAPRVHKCPACGFAPAKQNDIQTIAGELTLLDRQKRGKPSADSLRFGSKQEVWSMLLAYCRRAGWAKGAASHRYRAIFDVWPTRLDDVLMDPSKEIVSWIRSQGRQYAKSQARHAEQ